MKRDPVEEVAEHPYSLAALLGLTAAGAVLLEALLG